MSEGNNVWDGPSFADESEAASWDEIPSMAEDEQIAGDHTESVNCGGKASPISSSCSPLASDFPDRKTQSEPVGMIEVLALLRKRFMP